MSICDFGVSEEVWDTVMMSRTNKERTDGVARNRTRLCYANNCGGLPATGPAVEWRRVGGRRVPNRTDGARSSNGAGVSGATPGGRDPAIPFVGRIDRAGRPTAPATRYPPRFCDGDRGCCERRCRPSGTVENIKIMNTIGNI